jgi:biopolymer transport protein ExbD
LAFLLVTFFMLTTKFAPEESVVVDTPSSISEIKLPETGVAIITISNDDRVFYGVDGQFTKERLLGRIAEKYSLQFTEDEVKQFALMPNFGVPIAGLKSFLAMAPEERKNIQQPGIPTDSLKNELAEWVLLTRFSNPEIVFAIKGDKDAKYPTVGRVITTLQERKVNRFNLITSMENKPVIASN